MPPEKKPEKTKIYHVAPKVSPTVIIGGARNMPYQLAQCCTPEFPEALVAVSRSGGKCMVHAAECAGLDRVNPARILPAYWLVNEKGRVVDLTLNFNERKGILADLTGLLYQMGANIVDISAEVSEDGERFRVMLNIEIPKDDTSYIDRLVDRIRLSIPDFIGVES